MTDDNITKLPVTFKHPPSDDGPMLQIVETRFGSPPACNHSTMYANGRMVSAKYLIRDGETEVECSLCETKLEPMWVLRKLAHEETKFHRAHEAFVKESERLKERTSTKCNHCGKMTRISRR